MARISLNFIEDITYTDTDDSNLDKINYAKKILHQIIQNELTQKQKQVIILYFFENKTLSEIADELNLNKSTVCRNLHTALENIKKYIKYYNIR